MCLMVGAYDLVMCQYLLILNYYINKIQWLKFLHMAILKANGHMPHGIFFKIHILKFKLYIC
jgi:hypothetical protein